MRTCVAVALICMVALPLVKPNAINDVTQRMSAVTADNCRSGIDVYLPEDSVSHVPRYMDNPNIVQAGNRTSLQYALNTAVSRAIFLSFIYSWTRWTYDPAHNNLMEATLQSIHPGFNYFYMSNAANVLAGPRGVASSAIFFDGNSSYPDWLEDSEFNTTFPLFGVKAFKDEQVNRSTVDIKDLGSTPDTDYTNSSVYPQNAFYNDLVQSNGPNNQGRATLKATIHNGSSSSEDHDFYMKLNDEGELGSISRPFYDCGQSNEWVVSARSMTLDVMPRWTMWKHLRHLKAVASNTVDVLYETLDINPCPTSIGNPKPNRFADTSACPTQQECKVLHGQGLSANSHECCSTKGCSIDSTWTIETVRLGEIELGKADPDSCYQTQAPTQMVLGEDFWNTNHLMKHFEVQGRSALRLSHFLSNFLQNNDPANDLKNIKYLEEYFMKYYQEIYLHHIGSGPAPPDIDTPRRLIKSDHPLIWKWIAAEVFSTLVADGDLMSVGIYFDLGAFPDRQVPVSAFAWKSVNAHTPVSTRGRYSADVVDLFEIGEDFTTQDWFIEAKNKFNEKMTNGLPEFTSHQEVRSRLKGEPMPDPIPVTYMTVNYEDGTWLNPYFRCDVRQAGWAASYVAPIYAKLENGGLKFAGVVKTDARFTKYHISTQH